jgi:hypothetical protein
MGGIKGMPTPTPADLKTAPADPFTNAVVEQDPFDGAKAAPVETGGGEQQNFESPWYTSALPAAGGIAGGIAGAGIGGPAGAVVGAAAGGAAGQGYREWIETNILGKPISETPVKDAGIEGVKEGAGQLIGLGVVKGAGAVGTKIAGSKLGQAAGGKIAEIAAAPINYVKNTVKAVRENIESPLLEMITKKTNPMNAEQAGDQVKSLFMQDVEQRFGQATDLAEKYYAKFKDLIPKNVPSPADAHVQETYYNQFGELLPKSVNPKNFVETLQNVPSEKLIEKMWDPKNAAALRALQEEMPKVFDQVAQARMNQVLRKASPEGVLDLAGVRKAIYNMPEATRDLLMSGDEVKVMNQVLNSPRLARIKDLEKMGEEFVGKWSRRVYEMAHIGAEVVPKVADTAGVRQVIGKPFISPLANVIGGSPQAPPQE